MFTQIIQNIIRLGTTNSDFLAAIIVGSQARTNEPADQFSDLDLLLVLDNPQKYIETDDWLNSIGTVEIAYLSKTVTGTPEKRVIFEGAKDVDFVLNSISDIELAKQYNDFSILQNGYKILFDKNNFFEAVKDIQFSAKTFCVMNENDFVNLAKNFWYQGVWTQKKIMRGEYWTAIQSVNFHLKNALLQVVELYEHALHGTTYNTWHDGRKIEKWAEPWIINDLQNCFATFSKENIHNSLLNTMLLFEKVSNEAAKLLGYKYPKSESHFSLEYVKRLL